MFHKAEIKELEETVARLKSQVRVLESHVHYFCDCPTCERETLTRCSPYKQQTGDWITWSYCHECLICGTKYNVQHTHKSVPVDVKDGE